jgi:hypothetical protein
MVTKDQDMALHDKDTVRCSVKDERPVPKNEDRERRKTRKPNLMFY